MDSSDQFRNSPTEDLSHTLPHEPTLAELQQLRSEYAAAKQDHVFTFYDTLNSEEKRVLFTQLSSFKPQYINQITNSALNPPSTSHAKDQSLQPLPASATASILDSSPADVDKWYKNGLNLIAKNAVAVVLMAGGQGTRLGSSEPKGCYDIGLPSKKSLFQLQGERIKKIQRLAQKLCGSEKEVIVPWYVMTSGPTRKPTEAFFEKHNFFGLNKENVVIFQQGVLPCISNEGKILLESKGKVAVAPDGNGGIYQALSKSNILADMKKRGIEHVHAYCVDNCLVKVADPVFIGFSAEKGFDIATKVVRKRNATESVGLIVLKNEKPSVVEYSEIDKETAAAKDPNQPEILKFRAGNIVNHYYSFSFLETIPQWAHKLTHHVAHKKISYVDFTNGTLIKPEKPNGIKLEQFVFDCFSMLDLEKFGCLEVRREDEFSPLKNARGTGEDDPDSSRKDILDQGKRWVITAGAAIAGEAQENGIEISPLASYGGEGLSFLKGKTVTDPAILMKSA